MIYIDRINRVKLIKYKNRHNPPKICCNNTVFMFTYVNCPEFGVFLAIFDIKVFT